MVKISNNSNKKKEISNLTYNKRLIFCRHSSKQSKLDCYKRKIYFYII